MTNSTCPKCGATGGGDWTQCGGACPMPHSPHYDLGAVVESVTMEARKDAAYLERNQVVAALAKCFPSGVARTAIEGWSEDWHGCVYIDLPTGQASWHHHDSHSHLFEGLPAYTKPWDGHDTQEKYRRLAALEDSDSKVAIHALRETQQACDVSQCPWCGSWGQGYRDSVQPSAYCHHEYSLLPWQALTPKVSADDEVEFEIREITQGGDEEPYASAFGPRESAMREARHYAAQVPQAVVYEVTRRRIDL